MKRADFEFMLLGSLVFTTQLNTQLWYLRLTLHRACHWVAVAIVFCGSGCIPPSMCFTVPGEVCCLSNQVVVCPGGQFCPFMERVRQWLGRASRVSVKGISRPECEKDATSHSGPQPGLSADGRMFSSEPGWF